MTQSNSFPMAFLAALLGTTRPGWMDRSNQKIRAGRSADYNERVRELDMLARANDGEPPVELLQMARAEAQAGLDEIVADAREVRRDNPDLHPIDQSILLAIVIYEGITHYSGDPTDAVKALCSMVALQAMDQLEADTDPVDAYAVALADRADYLDDLYASGASSYSGHRYLDDVRLDAVPMPEPVIA